MQCKAAKKHIIKNHDILKLECKVINVFKYECNFNALVTPGCA